MVGARPRSVESRLHDHSSTLLIGFIEYSRASTVQDGCHSQVLGGGWQVVGKRRNVGTAPTGRQARSSQARHRSADSSAFLDQPSVFGVVTKLPFSCA